MKTFVCTCGTSIITKRAIRIDRIKDKPLTKWNEFEEEIEAIRDKVIDELSRIKLPEGLDNTSAEIKSLVKMGATKDDRVVLVCTDLIDGKLCGELVKYFLEKRKIIEDCPVEIKVVEGLQASNGVKFVRTGLKNLLEYLIKMEYEDVVFNVTGGYKSVVPYLALAGMIFNKPIKYIHEDSNDVLSLTSIPIILNDELILKVYDKLKKIDKESYISKDEWQSGIDWNDRRFDCLVEEIDGNTTLSGVGILFWERFKVDYPEDLIMDDTLPSEKKNKLSEQGIDHHGLRDIKLIASKLLSSPYVKSIPNSCEYQPNSKQWIRALKPDEAMKFLLRTSESICIVTNIKTDAGYSFFIETTARNFEENKRIAEILSKKYLL